MRTSNANHLCKPHSRRDISAQKYDPSKRRKSHADILTTSTNVARPPDLVIPTSASRRFSQVEVRDIKTFQSRALYTNKELNDLVKSPHCSQEHLHTSQKQLASSHSKLSCSRGHLECSSLTHSREQLSASQKRLSYSRGSRERLLSNSREEEEDDERENWRNNSHSSPECVSPDEDDDQESVVNIQTNCLSDIQNEANFLCQEHQNLQIAERLIGHMDDVSNSESEHNPEAEDMLDASCPLRENYIKKESGFRNGHSMNGQKMFIPKPKNGKSRRASLMPAQAEPLNSHDKKRRNSSTVLIIKGESKSGAPPIFINKEDGLPRFDVHC